MYHLNKNFIILLFNRVIELFQKKAVYYKDYGTRKTLKNILTISYVFCRRY